MATTKTSNDPVVNALKRFGCALGRVFGFSTLENTRKRLQRRTKAQQKAAMQTRKGGFIAAVLVLPVLLFFVGMSLYQIIEDPKNPGWYAVAFAYLFVLYLDVGYLARLHPQTPNGRALLAFTGIFGTLAAPLIVHLAHAPSLGLAIVASPFIVMMVLFVMHLARAVALHRMGWHI